jgi:hypothetical protein
MLKPRYENLRCQSLEEHPGVFFASCSTGPSGNPRFYRFFWRLFSLESPLEGETFLQHAPRLCNAQFEGAIERLRGHGMSYLVYGWRQPRRDPSNPWDLNNAKWDGVEFVPSWDDDIDPVVAGGHK